MSVKWSIPSLMVAFTPPALVLDIYTGSTAAYSLRKLRTGQTQCIRVRRSSDNTEQDVGFSGILLDVNSLTTFVGSGNGFISKWYDQSGSGNDAVQASTGAQPQIVTSGAVNTQNGKYAITFDGATSFLATGSISLTSGAGLWQCFGVAKFSDTNVRNVWDQDQSRRIAQFLRRNGTAVESIAFDTGNNPFTDAAGNPGTVQVLLYAIRTSSTVEIYLNNVSDGSTATTGTPNSGATIATVGANSNGGFQFMLGTIQEIIHYPNNTSLQTGVTNNINAYYSVY